MIHAYQPLPLHRLATESRFFCPGPPLPERVALGDPALSVMTDLRQVAARTVGRSTPLAEASSVMIERGVRLLLVCDHDNEVVGVLTGRDLGGGKVERILAKAGVAWEELVVADVMTIRPKLDALLMEEVSRARVGDIIATLRQADRQHALVLEGEPETGNRVVRGIFSLSQIGLRLGLNIDPSRRPTTYAELARAGYVV
ncbi:MAG: CBS domain-containing protein [Candidatus Competibacter denitrificans]